MDEIKPEFEELLHPQDRNNVEKPFPQKITPVRDKPQKDITTCFRCQKPVSNQNLMINGRIFCQKCFPVMKIALEPQVEDEEN